MKESGTYRPEELPKSLTNELERLEAQVKLGWTQEEQIIRRCGLRDGHSILEIGSGPGFVTERLLEGFPASPITAIEIRKDLLEMAQQRLAGKSPERLRFWHGPFQDFTLPPGESGYDFVLARYLFQHLEAPVDAGRAILKLLKPGGLFAAVDVDAELWGVAEPFRRELQPIYRKAERLQFDRQGSRLIGRRLWRILKMAGFEAPGLEAFVTHSDEHGLKAFEPLISPDRLVPAWQKGYVTTDELDTLRNAHIEFMESENAFVMMTGFLAHGTKSPA